MAVRKMVERDWHELATCSLEAMTGILADLDALGLPIVAIHMSHAIETLRSELQGRVPGSMG